MKKIFHEYRDIFESGKTTGYAGLSKLVGNAKEQVRVLSRHVYPLNSV